MLPPEQQPGFFMRLILLLASLFLIVPPEEEQIEIIQRKCALAHRKIKVNGRRHAQEQGSDQSDASRTG